ncbi:MAG: DUF4123 domain-containing protein [Pseudomonas sp.]
MTNWMLLERTDDLLPALFRQIDHPDFVPLFDTTELGLYSEFGPLLVKDNYQGALLQAMKHAPDNWPGLIIESEHSREALLEHLRHILIVRFELTRKGMLRYWNPSVASHFFPACSDENLNLWLGPISRLSWHIPSKAEWQGLDNPGAKAWQSATPNRLLTLAIEQCHALEQQRQPSKPTGQES